MRVRDLNWFQLEEYLRRDDRIVLPIGSTEQHAYLSLETDNILAERVAAEAAEPLGVPVLPVLAYGLRTDFQGELFEGSARLLAIADALIEIKSVCECGRKATMNLRVDAEGHAVASGAQTEIGGNDRYVALCRRHFFERLKEGEARQLSLDIPR